MNMAMILVLILAITGCASLSSRKEMIKGMVYIPSGSFIMGSNREDGKVGFEIGVDEFPRHEVYVRGFYIDRYEVTIGEYMKFLEATGNRPPQLWSDPLYQREKIQYDHPVVDVSWFEADAYCRFAGKRLPTEAEWEKAARGTDGRIYPWGDEFDNEKCNTEEKGILWTLSPGMLPGDRSPYGVMDMCGNAMEWTDSWYKPYPGSTLKRETFGEKYRVLRGSAYDHPAMGFARTTHRHAVAPEWDHPAYGIRCAY